MTDAARLLATLMSAKKRPGWAHLTWVEHRLEVAGKFALRWTFTGFALLVFAVAIAYAFVPLGNLGRVGMTLLLAANLVSAYGYVVVILFQAGVLVYVPTVRNAHEIHRFAHQHKLAEVVAGYPIVAVAEAELYLKQRMRRLYRVGAVLMGGQVSVGTLLAVLQGEALKAYLQLGASWLAPVFNMSTQGIKTGLVLGIIGVILQVAFILWIGLGYDWLTGVVEHSRLIRPAIEQERSDA